jgi:tetratricopeptide (TPR) repeat protein
MTTNKQKKIFVITGIVIVMVAGGLTFNTYVAKQKIQRAYVVTGLPEKQTGILKELAIVSTEHSFIIKGYDYLKGNEFDKAIEQFQTVLDRNKQTGALAEARQGLVDVYEKARDYKKATELQEIIISRIKIPKGDMWRTPNDERLAYLQYASNGDYDLAVEHAQKALEADAKLPNRPAGGRQDYIDRLNDLKSAKDYILGQKKK